MRVQGYSPRSFLSYQTLRKMVDHEQLQQEDQLFPWLNADYLDAMADLAYEQEQATRESSQSDWHGVEEISSEERNACDHYNERYIISTNNY